MPRRIAWCLAAGPGTRMRSDTPKVLHTLGGRSMLVARPARGGQGRTRSTWSSCWASDRERIAAAVAELADAAGPPHRHRGAGPAARHRARGAVRADGAARRTSPASWWSPPATSRCWTPTPWPTWSTTHSADAGRGHRADHDLPDPTGYGRVLRTQDGEVIAIVEQADATPQQRAIREVNSGVYAFDIAALRSALSRLRTDNAQHELYLTDVIAIAARRRPRRARRARRRQRAGGRGQRPGAAGRAGAPNSTGASWRGHQRAGVTVVDPATTWIDVDVTIGRDTVIQPGTQLLGATAVGGDCTDRPGHHADRRHRRRRRVGGPHPRQRRR